MLWRHKIAAALRFVHAVGFGERVLAQVRLPLIPAQAGIQCWVPAFAGTSGLDRRLAVAAALIAALGLSGCGRAGPLQLPPGPATPTAQLRTPDGAPAPGSAEDTAVRTGFDAQGNPVATPGQKKSFILDPILR
jgi:predicted small lipoprotein YifL